MRNRQPSFVGPQKDTPWPQIPTRDCPAVFHHVLADGTTVSTPATAAGDVRFEDGLPSRKIRQWPDQAHTPGLYWSATDDWMLGYESYLECKWLTILDFAPNVVAIATQPFHIQAIDTDGPWEHFPDIFVRLGNRVGAVIDVKDPRRVREPRVQVQVRRTAALCDLIGFVYRVVDEPDPTFWRNIEWLAGYRRSIELPAGLADQILQLAQTPTPIGALIETFDVPEITLSAVMRLCWTGALACDLTLPLRSSTRVHVTQPDSRQPSHPILTIGAAK